MTGILSNFSAGLIAELAALSLLIGILSGIIAVGVLPLLENLFKITTDITLLELTDFNHPLLRRMQIEAPGTYHHSLMVANLSENAAAAIGASPLLCRVCCFFHDIGKLVKPDYFTENQRGGLNPHDEKNPSMSALVIKAHVKEGVELAREHKLPSEIIDVIQQHHGTSLIQYFYHQARERLKDDQDYNTPTVDQSTYRYDGPRPAFKESAIIFFADGVEAASRTLPKVTQSNIEDLIDKIFRDRIEDGQLDDCPLTFQELNKIRESFVYTLLNMLHSRVEYPKDEDTQEGEPQGQSDNPATPAS
jgi:putative nucleotidyltransferase with HDIG domain